MNKDQIKEQLDKANAKLFETVSEIVQNSEKRSEERLEFFDILAIPIIEAVKEEIANSNRGNFIIIIFPSCSLCFI